MEPSNHWRCQIILLFIFTWTNFLASAGEICGSLDISHPAIDGRNVTLSFTPATQLQRGRVVWARSRTGNAWIDLPPSAKFVQHTTEHIHCLTITNSDKHVDGILYMVKYHNETGAYCTTTVKLDLTVLIGCGLLHLRTSRIVQNGTVELGYFPTSYILDYPKSYDRLWLRYSDDCPNGCRVITSETVEETLYPNYEYVLILNNFQSNLNGDFMVQCTTDRRKNKVTNPVHIALPDSPSMPELGPLETFKTCTNCILGEEEQINRVTYNESMGTENNATIRMGDNYLPLEQDINNEDYVTFIKFNSTLHHVNVTSSAGNHATTESLSVTANTLVIEFNFSHSGSSINRGSMLYIECFVSSNSVSRLLWYDDASVNDSLVECNPGPDPSRYGYVVLVIASIIIFCVVIIGLSLGIMYKRRKVKRRTKQDRIVHDVTRDDGEYANAYTTLHFDSSGESSPYAMIKLWPDLAADHQETEFGVSYVDKATDGKL